MKLPWTKPRIDLPYIPRPRALTCQELGAQFKTRRVAARACQEHSKPKEGLVFRPVRCPYNPFHWHAASGF